MSSSAPPPGSASMKSTPANIPAVKPCHSGTELANDATIFMGMFEMERIPLIASKIILIDVEWVFGIRKTIDECNSNHLCMKNYVNQDGHRFNSFYKNNRLFFITNP